MNLDDKNLRLKLCEAYFSILEKSDNSDISLDQLCLATRTSKEEVEKMLPKNLTDLKIFFLKILISNIEK